MRSKEKTIRGTKFYGGMFLSLIFIFTTIYYYLPSGYINYGSSEVTFIKSLYFSIVTITTLGYGDILPVEQVAFAIVSLESILGVITIGLYLNSISAKLSMSVSNAEKNNEIRKKRIMEIERILRYDKLFQIDLRKYIIYASLITTPTVNRTNEEIEKISKYRNMKSDFVFSDLADLYTMTPFLTDKLFAPAIIKYYKYEKILINDFKHIASSFDIELLGDFETELLELIQLFLELDFSEAIIGGIDIQMGDKKATEVIPKLIREYEGEPKFQGSHILTPYIGLFIQLKSISEVITKYNEKVENLVIELKSLESI